MSRKPRQLTAENDDQAPRLTAASTAELPDMVRECLPPEYAELTLRLFAERERRRQADHARGQRVREARTAKLEALCAWAYETYSLKVTDEVDPTRWASFLQGKIDNKINPDLPENDPHRKRPPSLDFIRGWLRQNGILS